MFYPDMIQWLYFKVQVSISLLNCITTWELAWVVFLSH